MEAWARAEVTQQHAAALIFHAGSPYPTCTNLTWICFIAYMQKWFRSKCAPL